MKKRIAYSIAVAAILGVVFLNVYLKIEYDMNMFEYFVKPGEISREEQEWLKSHGKIRYISDQTSPPLRYVDGSDEQFRGLIVDYMSALSIEVGQVISVESTNLWSESLEKLVKGESDFLDLVPSDERAEIFDFSDPMYTLRENILFRKDGKEIKHYSDLKYKTVAIAKGDYAIEFLKSKVRPVNYLITEDSESAILLLRKGEADAVVGEEDVIHYFVEKMDMEQHYKTLEKPFIEEEAVLAVRKGEKELLSILNKGLYSLKKKKTIKKIHEKWFGAYINLNKSETSQMIALVALVFISLICLIVYLSYSWNSMLKKEVMARTEQLYSTK